MVMAIEKWEFGSSEWCDFAAQLGVCLLKSADLNLQRITWGFSEEYLAIPERLLGNRERAGYHLMIRDGQVTGGSELSAACASTPGFHVAIEWATIAHSSYLPFNHIGHIPRGKAQIRLRKELQTVGHGNGKWVLEHTMPNFDKTGSLCAACGSNAHARENCPVWPPGLGEALGANPDAKAGKWRLKRSRELEGFPESEWGVPLFHEMSDMQKLKFLDLMGTEPQIGK